MYSIQLKNRNIDYFIKRRGILIMKETRLLSIPETFTNSDDYFVFFETKIMDFKKKQTYPKVVLKMEKICRELRTKIDCISAETFFTDISEILGYDAQLQIILQLTEQVDNISFTDEEILEITKTDYIGYFKELCGYRLEEKPSHSLHFSIC